MARRERVDDLLARWEELREQGRAPTAEELAPGEPELAGELRAAIARLRAMDWLDEPSSRSTLELVGEPTPRELLERVPPLLAGRYRMERVLAEGGFSQVWRALDTALQRPVAVKVTAVDCVAEARRVAGLRHPGIVGVHDVGNEGGLCFIVFDLIEGTDLAQRLRAGPMPWPEAARLVADVADLLHYAHEKGFIHRDVKPANILLDAEGKAVLADFGIAVTPCELLQETLSTPGTLAYMAPEQLGGGQVGVRSDVYGLGVVLYQALTGQLPFRDATLWGLRREILTAPARPAQELVPELPTELDCLCLRCLAKDPGERPGTAAELARALRACLPPPPDEPTSPSSRPRHG